MRESIAAASGTNPAGRPSATAYGSPNSSCHERMEPPPVFVGGTGRSGTTVTARLIGQHTRYHCIPFELRLHAEPRGVPGLINGKQSGTSFAELLRKRWHPDHPKQRGMRRSLTAEEFDLAVERFMSDGSRTTAAGGRALVRSILDPVAARAGKPGWVEMTPVNAAAAPSLAAMFPELKLLHVVRDGRDVACSLHAHWKKDVQESLEWWDRRLRSARARCGLLPRDHVLTLSLEDLVVRDRERSFARVLEFLALEPEPAVTGFFESTLTDPRSSIGRWRRDLDPPLRRRVERRYLEILEGLRRDEVIDLPA